MVFLKRKRGQMADYEDLGLANIHDECLWLGQQDTSIERASTKGKGT